MLSRRDRENKKKNFFSILAVLLVAGVLIATGIFSGSALRNLGAKIFHPFFVFGQGVGNGVSNAGYLLKSKKSLLAENNSLKEEIKAKEASLIDRNILSDENIKLKEILNRKKSADMVLATILAKPNRSLYDTLVLDIGEKDGIKIGDYVFAHGILPMGEIIEVSGSTSKARLFSSPGVSTEAVISGTDTYVTLTGRGGSSFEVSMPRDVPIENGTLLTIPNIAPYIIAEAVEIISDPRDPEKKALFRSPVVLNEIKFVQVFKSEGSKLEQ